MNMFAKFDEIPSMILQDIKETKRYGHTVGLSDGQCENSIPSHKHSLRGIIIKGCASTARAHENSLINTRLLSPLIHGN